MFMRTLVLLFQVSIALSQLSGGYWFYNSGSGNIVHADFAFNPIRSIDVNGIVTSLIPVPQQKMVYYIMNNNYIFRSSFDGSEPQLLVSGTSLGQQFIVDPVRNALWYQNRLTTFRCAQNGQACIEVTSVKYSMGMALAPDTGMVYVGNLASGPSVDFYQLNYSSGVINVTQLDFNTGCCHGSFSDIYLATPNNGREIWSSLVRDSNSRTIYKNGTSIANIQVAIRPPFFFAPKNPQSLYFTYGNSKITHFNTSSRTVTQVNGRMAEYIEPSTCNSDCSLNGNCIADSCSCFANYYGSICSVFCSPGSTCSGHGKCGSDGSCICDKYWSGPNCNKLVLNPPVFPPEFSAFSVRSGNSMHNLFYDFFGQRTKYAYTQGGYNQTYLYNIGYLFTVYLNQSCVSEPLHTVLDRWQVDPNATLVEFPVPCGVNDTCSSWKSATTNIQWLVNSQNLPLIVNVSGDVTIYDPTKYVVGDPDPRVWEVPNTCNQMNIINNNK